ncbi:MAG: circadian clock protein KaiC [Pseudomonadota bacterium]
MATRKKAHTRSAPAAELPKCPTGIRGLDQITRGGLPQGRPTLVCGGAGTGKTLFGMEFLVRGALEHGEAGVFVSFEERPVDLVANTASLGFDLDGLVANKKLLIDQVAIDRSEIMETGEYNLDGLFIRLGAAIQEVQAKRVVLDTIEVLFGALSNVGILRSELRRLFAWLKDQGVTCIVTGERGEGSFTRHGLEEYVSDCVILLDQRMVDQIATRRLRITKYRGSLHGTNEYPFLIDEHGFLVLPITSIALDYATSDEVVSTGVAKLDAMFGGKGYFRGSTMMVSGQAGTGKTSLAAHLVDAACRRGERSVYFSFEESPAQLARNMRSIGIDLEQWVKRGLLRILASRPATFGLEVHISMILKQIDAFDPRVVVLDPVTSFEGAGTALDASSMLMRMIDLLKARQVTTLFTSLTEAGDAAEQTGLGLSSMIDSWILLRNIEQGGERTRGLYILKARGMTHSNQVRELLITDHGVDLQAVELGPDGVLLGSARLAQQERDRAAASAAAQEIAHQTALLARKRAVLDARIKELESDFAAESHDIGQVIAQGQVRQDALVAARKSLAESRGQDAAAPSLPAKGGRK